MAHPSNAANGLLSRTASAGLSTIRATAQWTLFFAISFSVTAGVLILAHV